MARQNVTPAPVARHPYRGSVYELKHLLEPVAQAAFLCRHNVLLIGEKGWGKSEIEVAMATQVFGDDHVGQFNGTAAMKPSKISGRDNVRYALDPVSAIARGEKEIITDGTMYDENFWVMVFHEMTRPNEFTLDELVEAMDRISRRHKAILIGNANWLNVSPRTEAIYDRVGFTVLYEPSPLDLPAIVRTAPPATWDYDLPTIDEINEVNSFPVTDSALKLVDGVFSALEVQLPKTEFRVNPRRAVMWKELIVRMSQWKSGSPEVTEIPKEAYRALEWAFPATSQSMSLSWRKIVGSIYDPIAEAIAEFMKTAYNQWKTSFQNNSRNPEAVRVELGALLADAQQELYDKHGDDPRVMQAIGTLDSWYFKACKGETF